MSSQRLPKTLIWESENAAKLIWFGPNWEGMTSLVDSESLRVVKDLCTLHTTIDSVSHRQPRHALKPKERVYKHKCNNFLRNKFKKYKLKQDAAEDEDVINVSKILVSSLVIKSPSKEQKLYDQEGELNIFEALRPKNYLFKMARGKGSLKTDSGVKVINGIKVNGSVELSNSIVNENKKHTNAFDLLMDSRNKSIGTNSPGKEQNQCHLDVEKVSEKKTAKAKRDLLLQKMADAKGYSKNKEINEYQDRIIKKKMDKRAKRLKAMILKESKQPQENKEDNSDTKKTNNFKLLNNIQSETIKSKAKPKEAKNFKIVDIFNTFNDAVNESPEKKPISQEDKEFLNKLSPSLVKKESMLSYFKKVNKPEPSSIDLENDLIRVKIEKRPKKKVRNKKQASKRDNKISQESLEVNDENNEIINCNTNTSLLESAVIPLDNFEANERQKRKRRVKVDKNCDYEIDNTALNNNTDCRPKRCNKKPIKYTNDTLMSSSDEELHIFTPKKKKINDSNSKRIVNNNLKINVCNLVKSNDDIKKVKDTITPKKPIKLAPIFATKQLDSAALIAKQKFLQSGVPEKLKKRNNQQNNNNNMSDFTMVVHVQQKDLIVEGVHQQLLNVFESDTDDTCIVEHNENAFKKLLNLEQPSNTEGTANMRRNVKTILENIKQLHPKFPVYRTYRYLRSKGKGEFKESKQQFDNSIEIIDEVVDSINESPERLNWTDKYKAMSTNQIVGNFESMKELRKWLVSWTENHLVSKKNKDNESDSSDFYLSDTDSRESMKSMNNLLILTGPTGCGKTSSVYAVAAELAMKVIEVNASSKRTGKIMLQDLQEATQSHKVNRGTSTDNSQKSQEKNLTGLIKKNKKRGRPKKSLEKQNLEDSETLISISQESARTDMSLILIDDADIVFDQDDGFSSAIVQLVHCSKRPVILITSSLMPPHLQRFFQNGKILKMSPLLPRLLGTWLDILCLADNGISWPGVGAKFLDYFKGDIRKTINYLQFYISGYTSLISDDDRLSQNIDYCNTNVDDENSGISWAESDLDSKKSIPVHDIDSNTMWADFVSKNSDLTKYRYPVELFDIWWSLPHLLHLVPVPKTLKILDNKSPQKKSQEVAELEAIADAVDAISLSDYLRRSHPDSAFDITARPWYYPDTHSMSEQNNIEYYTNRHEVSDEISHAMVTGRLVVAQDILKCERKKIISFPGMSMQRQREKVVSRHTVLTSYLNPWVILDRRSLAMDYWPSCRTICRLEKTKNDGNIHVKRNNRFCHYLKSLNVLCKSDTFDNLCDSLSNHGTNINTANL